MPESNQMRSLIHRFYGILFLTAAMALALGPWLRPPFEPDINAASLSLATTAAPSRVLNGAGVFCAAGAIGLILILWMPQTLSFIAGSIMVMAMAFGTSVIANRPELIERLDRQRLERQDAARFLEHAVPGALTKTSNARVPGSAATLDHQASLMGAWSYLARGIWLVPFCGLILLASTPGRLGYRLGRLAGFLVTGLVLSGIIGGRRLMAEYYLESARTEAGEGNIAAARDSIARSVEMMASLRALERTQLLIGRLDTLAQPTTPAAAMYMAARLEHAGHFHRARAILLDQWVQSPDDARFRHALARNWTEQGFVWAAIGRHSDRSEEEESPSLPAIVVKSSNASAAWQQAVTIEPPNAIAARLCLGAWQAERSRGASHSFSLLESLPAVDRAIHADVLSLLGDAKFHRGDLRQARERYRESMKAWMLPKTINYRAQRGLGGL
jgi:hypothetical protein